MALLNDILNWTETDLPLWQRDAARRLLTCPGELTDTDYTQLYGLLKATHGLSGPPGLAAVPLAAEHLPAAVPATTTVVLRTMRDLVDVNRIAPGQRLDFCGPTGMTVIYGGNASGKSGYARVLKRACRARDQNEPVHPDATDAMSQGRTPEAMFDIDIGGTTKALKWTAAIAPPDELSTVAVFDCHCARAYLSEGEPAYMPYGLDIVENLAKKVLPEMSRRLNTEIFSINVDRQPFDHLLGDTQVGRVVESLSNVTETATVRTLATLTDADRQRLAELDAALSVVDPKAKSHELRLSAGRLKALVGRVEVAQAWVSDGAVKKLRQLDEDAAAAGQAEKQAADALRSGENLLPGTGEQVWKEMFVAARKFSTEVAYPGQRFPHGGAGAVCPLCQQPVAGVCERLERFEQYITEDISRTATKRREEVEAARTKIRQADLSVGLDDTLRGELALIDDKVAQVVDAFQEIMKVRRTWMQEALLSHAWNNAPSLGESPRQRLRNLAARQLRSARTFLRASLEEENRKLKAERDELRARHGLSVALDAVVALVERMKEKAALESCKADLDTRSISYKSKEFASGVVTVDLKNALDTEFNSLGIDHVKVALKQRAEKGRTFYRLVLDLPRVYVPEEILSEGEQRAIAIGSFLAELKLANHTGAIIFDDPVSSLDHWRRRNVARRLVEEAKRRQVVVLTHDTVFLGELMYALEQSGVSHKAHNMEWRDCRPGHVSEGLPWEHQKYTERIDSLEKAQKALEKLPWPAYPNQDESSKMRQQYDRLRATIERVIEDVVFNGVVKRYRDWINVRLLGDVVGFDPTEFSAIERLHKRCCDVVEAHDPASPKNAPVPSAADLGKDMEALKNVIESIKTRRHKKVSSSTPPPSS